MLYIKPGQSLGALVQRLYPARPDRWAAIRDWIVRNNPHASDDGDPDRLRADVRVKLPSGPALSDRDPYSRASANNSDANTASALEFRDRREERHRRRTRAQRCSTRGHGRR